MAQPVSSMSLSATHFESLARRLVDHVGMPFVAKSAAPNAPHGILRHATLDQAAAGTLTLFNAPAGYLLADSLAATLAEYGRSILHSHHLNYPHPTMEPLCVPLLSNLLGSFTYILTTREDMPHISLPPQIVRRGGGVEPGLDLRFA